MKVSLFLMTLFVVAAVASANRKQRKLNRGGCRPSIQWTKCTEGKMIKTFVVPDTGNVTCNKPPAPVDVDCVSVKIIKDSKKPCAIEIRHDYTPCGEGQTEYTITKSFTKVSTDTECSQNKTFKAYCTGGKVGKGAAAKAEKKALKKKYKADLKAFKLQKREELAKGCEYQKTAECVDTKMKLPKVSGGEECADDLYRPCFGMKRAGRKNKKKLNRKMKRKNRDCKYRQGTWSECDAITNKKSMTRMLKRGDPEQCPETQVIEKLCRGKPKSMRCKYKRGEWSECDGATNIKRMVKTLKRGNPNICEPTQVKEKICKRAHKGLKNDCVYKKKGGWSECDTETGLRSRTMMLKKGKMCLPTKVVTKTCRKRKGKRACKYDKSPWGPCDAASNTVTRTLTLNYGDSNACNASKVEVRRCKNKHLRPHVCKYRRTTWGECDPNTNMRTMVKTLKRGDPGHCQPTMTVKRKCKAKNKANVCKYKYEDWSECDMATNTMTRKQILKSGPSTCQLVKEYSKKCKKPCRFKNGDWSECDAETNQMTRTDTLSPNSADFCPKTRVLTKKCGKKGKSRCQYNYGTWSECDQSEQPKRTRVQTLISGGPNCKPEKTIEKSCMKPNGKERCFFGPWEEYDACQNGVQKKHRQVLQGGLECERKGVKMKAC